MHLGEGPPNPPIRLRHSQSSAFFTKVAHTPSENPGSAPVFDVIGEHVHYSVIVELISIVNIRSETCLINGEKRKSHCTLYSLHILLEIIHILIA